MKICTSDIHDNSNGGRIPPPPLKKCHTLFSPMTVCLQPYPITKNSNFIYSALKKDIWVLQERKPFSVGKVRKHWATFESDADQPKYARYAKSGHKVWKNWKTLFEGHLWQILNSFCYFTHRLINTLKPHYAFNVNKLQDTKSSLSLLISSLQSHLHIHVLFSWNCGCSTKFGAVEKRDNNKPSSCLLTSKKPLFWFFK